MPPIVTHPVLVSPAVTRTLMDTTQEVIAGHSKGMLSILASWREWEADGHPACREKTGSRWHCKKS